MCGIAGIIDFTARPIDAHRLDHARRLLHHRGPDDSGQWVDQQPALSVGLAATRLAILDLSPTGRQPMLRGSGWCDSPGRTECGIRPGDSLSIPSFQEAERDATPPVRCALVFNGLIYNFREIAADLCAHWMPACDTEVVLAACARWGRDALRRFNGMFALAFYDRAERRGFLARDPFGIKPLLYAEHEGRLTFASEMPALRPLGAWPDDVDADALIHYLHFGFIPHPATIHRAARRLSPGCCLAFCADGAASPLYYDNTWHDAGSSPAARRSPAAAVARPDAVAGFPLGAPEPRPPHRRCAGPATRRYGDSAIVHRVRRALFHAVARRRVSDVPVGAFLSGGVDSAIVVAHLAELSPAPVRTFSIAWPDQPALDESRYARLVARRFGTEHHELPCRSADVLDILPAVLDHLGEPFFDSSILAAAIVSRFARKHVTVCLSGDGGDELFGGYWRYHAHHIHDRMVQGRPIRARLWHFIARSLPAGKSGSVSRYARRLGKLLRTSSGVPFVRHLAWSRILAPSAESIFRAGGADDSALAPFDRIVPPLAVASRISRADASADPLNDIMDHDLNGSLPDDMLHKVDTAGMLYSLEVRVPFLDPDVVALARSLPSFLKTHRGQGKIILKQAYRGLLPDEILDRDKMGFEVPIGEFLRGPLRDLFLNTVTRETVDYFEVLDYDAVLRVYEDHCRRREDHADLLFALLSLCHWRLGTHPAAAPPVGG